MSEDEKEEYIYELSLHGSRWLSEELYACEQELKKYKEIFKKVESTIEDMMYYGYSVSNEGTVTNYMATSDNSEFGSRAKVLIDILKEIK